LIDINAMPMAVQQPAKRKESIMTLAAIMVCVDFDEGAEDRVRVAAGIAGRFNAVLIGVAGWPLRKHEALAQPGGGTSPVEEGQLDKISERMQLLGEKFRQSAGANPGGVEWRSSTHFPSEVIVAQARAADLVVIGRDALPGDVFHTYDPGTVILAAGRPVLVVPRGIRRFQPSQVLIAWKDTREARRAVRDALPLLKEAQSVSIAAVKPQGAENGDRQIADVAQYLVRHHVSIGQQIETVAGEEEGQILLQLAKEHAADLIVAGAYGHTRLSEWIFGGVTRHLLMTSAVPCLFSS
jgi:nucleotide-binding universal stress UspA family protein